VVALQRCHHPNKINTPFVSICDKNANDLFDYECNIWKFLLIDVPLSKGIITRSQKSKQFPKQKNKI
jgi:hypothetical protein